jgi:hypothetical protein
MNRAGNVSRPIRSGVTDIDEERLSSVELLFA